MEPDPQNILELLDSAARSSTTVTLRTVHAPPSGPVRGWVMEPTLFLLLDATVDHLDLTVHRSPAGIHVLRDGADVLRVAGDTCWDFRDGVVHAPASALSVLGATRWFLFPELLPEAMQLDEASSDDVRPGRVGDRDTWVITRRVEGRVHRDHPQEIDIDRETGVLLAVSTPAERVEVGSLSFPGELPDPAWDGESRPWQPEPEPEPEEQEQSLRRPEPDVPVVLSEPRHLFVHATWGDLYGFRVGDTIALPLALRDSTPPLPALWTTRRAWAHGTGHVSRYEGWQLLLRGDAWAATYDSPVPPVREAEFRGWFDYSGEGAWNHLRVVRIWAGVGDAQATDPELHWQEVEDSRVTEPRPHLLQSMVLEVSPDDVTPPPLEPAEFTGGEVHVDGEHLWRFHSTQPVLRCWDLTTGGYLGQTLLPTLRWWGMEMVRDIITDGSCRWRVEPGEALAEELPVDFPVTEDTPSGEVTWAQVAGTLHFSDASGEEFTTLPVPDGEQWHLFTEGARIVVVWAEELSGPLTRAAVHTDGEWSLVDLEEGPAELFP